MTTSRMGGDFAKFIAEYQTESEDDVGKSQDKDVRFQELQVRWLHFDFNNDCVMFGLHFE
jgi:hypothetical protein